MWAISTTWAFVALCEKLAASYGARFQPTPLLKDMAAKDETFYRRCDSYGTAAKQSL
jgi:3-hydroxyacyl-CoA dehydrogenase/enoyl-CoA hydratase/3-hydroxybutyryl-CoA epimerase